MATKTKTNLTEKYIYDSNGNKIEVIIPYIIYERIKSLIDISDIEKDVNSIDISKGHIFTNDELEKILKPCREALKTAPYLDMDKTINEDRDRF